MNEDNNIKIQEKWNISELDLKSTGPHATDKSISIVNLRLPSERAMAKGRNPEKG